MTTCCLLSTDGTVQLQPGARSMARATRGRRNRTAAGNISAFLELRNEIAVEAAARGLTDARLAELLSGDAS